MNSSYTSPILVNDLLKKSTFSIGTVHPNRKNFPENVKVNKKMNVTIRNRNFRFATCEDLTAVLWRDRLM